MAIGSVIQRGRTIYVYDERGRVLFTRDAGSGPEDGLKGYTSDTVTIRRGHTLYVLDERGRVRYTRNA
jgi:isopentenyldiphosphate isomerase